MSAWLVPLIWVSYLAAGLVSARHWFGSVRPYREPLACSDKSDYHTHYGACYERVMTIDTAGMAVFVSIVGGLGWPLTWFVVLTGPPLKRWFAKASPDTPEEVAAKIARMEREMKL